MQYLQKCKYYHVGKDHIRKPLQSSARLIFKRPVYFQSPFNFRLLVTFNFCLILTISLENPSKTGYLSRG